VPEDPTPTPTPSPGPPERSGPAEQAVPPEGPRQSRNDFSWVGLGLAIIAVFVSLASNAGYGPGLAALLFSAIGVFVATRHDIGMARSLAGVLLSLFALAVAVYTAGVAAS
jgi:hypothetical protein